MSQIMVSVGISVNGSRKAVVGSGTSNMSLSLICLPAANAGAVKALAVLKRVFGQLSDRNRRVLPRSNKVHESQIDDFTSFSRHNARISLGVKLHLLNHDEFQKIEGPTATAIAG